MKCRFQDVFITWLYKSHMLLYGTRRNYYTAKTGTSYKASEMVFVAAKNSFKLNLIT